MNICMIKMRHYLKAMSLTKESGGYFMAPVMGNFEWSLVPL